jgi:polysaccharide export outer membrane protein
MGVMLKSHVTTRSFLISLFGTVSLLLISLIPLAGATERQEDYRLGGGDVIRISVYEYPDLTTEIRISETGKISFPLVGEFTIAQLTVVEAERLIAKKLDEGGFIQQAQVTLLVEQFKSREMSVLGMVNKPGKYPLEKNINLLDALALAGGIASNLASDSALLLRENGEKITIDLYALLNGDTQQNHLLQAGDAFVIPKAPQFYIYGEVQRPGIYKLERNMTVTQAISAGGGLTPRGSERRPIIKRKNVEGREEELSVNGSEPVQVDDVLYIRESWF